MSELEHALCMHSEQSDAMLARRGGWREAVLSWQVSVPSAKVVAVEEARGTATAQAKDTAEVSVVCVCVCVLLMQRVVVVVVVVCDELR